MGGVYENLLIARRPDLDDPTEESEKMVKKLAEDWVAEGPRTKGRCRAEKKEQAGPGGVVMEKKKVTLDKAGLLACCSNLLLQRGPVSSRRRGRFFVGLIQIKTKVPPESSQSFRALAPCGPLVSDPVEQFYRELKK